MRIVLLAGLSLSCFMPPAAFALDDTPTTPYLAPSREEPHAPPAPEPQRSPAKSAAGKTSPKK